MSLYDVTKLKSSLIDKQGYSTMINDSYLDFNDRFATRLYALCVTVSSINIWQNFLLSINYDDRNMNLELGMVSKTLM